MKAAILKAFGSPLVVEDAPEPVLGTGEVIVDVAAAGVLAYSKEVYSGERKYLLELPAIPGSGGIGRVRRLAPDATHLAVGDWVFCDPTVRSRDDQQSPDINLQGLSAGSEGGVRLARYFHDGCYAEQVRIPTENAIRLGAIEEADAPKWCALGAGLVSFGGFLGIDLNAGETVVVSGATGGFGSGGVAVAVAMGAARVVATGRNEKALAGLGERFGDRVRAVKMTGDEKADTKRIQDAADGPIDCVLDLLPALANASQVRAAILSVRPYGRVALMGGVGLSGEGGLDLNYRWVMRNSVTIRGQWMYRADAPARLVSLARAGLFDLGHWSARLYPLAKINEAVEDAAKKGPFEMTIIQPGR